MTNISPFRNAFNKQLKTQGSCQSGKFGEGKYLSNDKYFPSQGRWEQTTQQTRKLSKSKILEKGNICQISTDKETVKVENLKRANICQITKSTNMNMYEKTFRSISKQRLQLMKKQ